MKHQFAKEPFFKAKILIQKKNQVISNLQILSDKVNESDVLELIQEDESCTVFVLTKCFMLF